MKGFSFLHEFLLPSTEGSRISTDDSKYVQQLTILSREGSLSIVAPILTNNQPNFAKQVNTHSISIELSTRQLEYH